MKSLEEFFTRWIFNFSFNEDFVGKVVTQRGSFSQFLPSLQLTIGQSELLDGGGGGLCAREGRRMSVSNSTAEHLFTGLHCVGSLAGWDDLIFMFQRFYNGFVTDS